MMVANVLLLPVWLLLAAPSPPDDSVLEAADRAAAHVKAGQYDEAVAVIEQAAKTQEHPVFVYVRGFIEEERGHCAEAIEHYDLFLALDVPEVDAREARRRKERCERLLQVAAQPPTVPAIDPPLADPSPEGSTRVAAPWYADPAGATLVVLGVAGAGTGLGLYLQAQADERAAKRSGTVGGFDRLARRAEALSRGSIAALSIGAALLVAGIVRYAVVGTRSSRRRDSARAAKLDLTGPTLTLSF
jgi:tetratricopeptide (TPR) repeat protein